MDDSRRQRLVELVELYPNRLPQFSDQVQELLGLCRICTTAAEIGARMREPMTADAVRQAMLRAEKKLRREGKYSSFIGLLVSFMPIKPPLAGKGSATAPHAHSGVAMPMTGLMGAAAVAAGVFSLSVPVEFPLRSEVVTIHATTPASTGVTPVGTRQVATGNDKLTATRPASVQARSSATTAAPSAASPLPQVSVPARGHAQLSPDLRGGVLGTQDASAESPAGKLIFQNELKTTGPTTAWRECTRVDAPTCRKANARGASLSRSEASLPSS